MFEALKSISRRAKRLRTDQIAKKVWSNREVQKYIISLNIYEQLYDLGIDAKGQSLGDYAEFTIKQKKKDGLPYDVVTLYQEGDFYQSFKVYPESDGFRIEADTEKTDKDLAEVYGDAIIGLTDENKRKLAERILIYVTEEIKKRLIGY